MREAAKSLTKINEDPNILHEADQFIHKNFYVDDGLGCANTCEKAIRVLKAAKEGLAKTKIRLHKIVSNEAPVLNAFPECERGDVSSTYDFENCPTQRTLGVAWDIRKDCFTVKVDIPEKPFTKRGLLATVNSIYDPIGIASPVVLGGRLIQRRIFPRKDEPNSLANYDWDDVLPERYLNLWEDWKESLNQLTALEIPRCFKPKNFGLCTQQILHVFADASEEAIGLSIYLLSINERSERHVSFVCGESRVAPRNAGSMPRLELCAALQAVYSASKVYSEMNVKPNCIKYYTDSTVVLAYINSTDKRFPKYVTRRIEIILRLSDPGEWNYIPSEENPADIATRPTSARELSKTNWLTGPSFLKDDHDSCVVESFKETNDLDLELEISPLVPTTKTVDCSFLGVLFKRVNNWNLMLKVVKN